jgi:hypothetical protein
LDNERDEELIEEETEDEDDGPAPMPTTADRDIRAEAAVRRQQAQLAAELQDQREQLRVEAQSLAVLRAQLEARASVPSPSVRPLPSSLCSFTIVSADPLVLASCALTTFSVVIIQHTNECDAATVRLSLPPLYVVLASECAACCLMANAALSSLPRV